MIVQPYIYKIMKYNFCTLFDRNYLFRGLALHGSLLKTCDDFKLWILCVDDITLEMLKKINLPKVELISLEELEDKELLTAKKTRTAEEYCWTCTPAIISYILNKHPEIELLSYLDADLYFFSSPQPIFEEFGENSIMIIPHRFPPEKKSMEKTKGIYNVSMITFRNNANGVKCLDWWREKCLDWCYHYYDNGRLGDQLYLNDWPERFKGVHVLKAKGANLAPWNISQYKISRSGQNIYVNNQPLIFYHFHSLNIYSELKFEISKFAYKISLKNKKIIYKPYLEQLKCVIQKIRLTDNNFRYGFSVRQDAKNKIRKIIKKLLNYHRPCRWN